MATEFVISGKSSMSAVLLYVYIYIFPQFSLDAGTIYKRLLNHRPVIQNEVHYFVKEFEVSHAYV